MARVFPKLGYNPATGEWNDSLAGEFLWSNVNVSEAVPDVMTPSTWSLWWIYHYEASPFEFPGNYPFCGNFCGRPYLNLSLISSLYRAVGKDVRKELQGDMIGSAPTELDIPFIPFSPLAVFWKVLPGMLKAQQNASRDSKQMPEFLAEIPGWRRTIHAQLFADQQLVTTGPYTIVRHPMYAGLFLAAAGSLLIYHTWTTLLFACIAPLLVFRARREDTAMAAEYGELWQGYCQRVPAFLPRIRR